MPSFFFWDLGSSLLSLLRILFWVDYNSFLVRLPITTWFFFGVLSCSFVWSILLCCLILSNLPRLPSLFSRLQGSSGFWCPSPSLWNFCPQAPLAFKAKCSGGLSFRCQISSMGSLTWDSEVSLLWDNLCDIIIFHFVGPPPDRYAICIAVLTLPLSCVVVFIFVIEHHFW